MAAKTEVHQVQNTSLSVLSNTDMGGYTTSSIIYMIGLSILGRMGKKIIISFQQCCRRCGAGRFTVLFGSGMVVRKVESDW